MLLLFMKLLCSSDIICIPKCNRNNEFILTLYCARENGRFGNAEAWKLG